MTSHRSLPRLGGSLLQVVRNYMGADAATRESRKMGMMLTGAVVGLAPVTANVLIGLVSPSTFIPTSQYWFLALAAIPITFALAAVHGSVEKRSPMIRSPAENRTPVSSGRK